jgi:hypothetical protein
MTVMAMATTTTLPLTRLEAWWASLVLPAFAGSRRGFTVDEAEVDYLAALGRFLGAASQKARLGVRLAFFLVVTAPLWHDGRLRGLASLSATERSELLDAMSRHRFFVVRELCLLLKLVACMAIFRAPSARARSGYDGRMRDATPASAVDAMRSRRRALPVVLRVETSLDEAQEGAA